SFGFFVTVYSNVWVFDPWASDQLAVIVAVPGALARKVSLVSWLCGGAKPSVVQPSNSTPSRGSIWQSTVEPCVTVLKSSGRQVTCRPQVQVSSKSWPTASGPPNSTTVLPFGPVDMPWIARAVGLTVGDAWPQRPRQFASHVSLT